MKVHEESDLVLDLDSDQISHFKMKTDSDSKMKYSTPGNYDYDFYCNITIKICHMKLIFSSVKELFIYLILISDQIEQCMCTRCKGCVCVCQYIESDRERVRSLSWRESQCRCCSAVEGSLSSLFSTFHRGNACHFNGRRSQMVSLTESSSTAQLLVTNVTAHKQN